MEHYILLSCFLLGNMSYISLELSFLSSINCIYTSRFAGGDEHQGCRLIHSAIFEIQAIFFTIILHEQEIVISSCSMNLEGHFILE